MRQRVEANSDWRGNRSPPMRLAKASASSGLAKPNTAKSLSSRRRKYVRGVADRS
jgi:hypothetical protein